MVKFNAVSVILGKFVVIIVISLSKSFEMRKYFSELTQNSSYNGIEGSMVIRIRFLPKCMSETINEEGSMVNEYYSKHRGIEEPSLHSSENFKI
jgi:hypothetical protein